MNPLTNMKNVLKLSERELKGNNRTSSWHDMYKDSAWIFVAGFPYKLTEGDLLCVFSQYGEIVNVNLVRDKKTGKSRGFCFVCYEDQRSTILAVDNLNGIKILDRIIRVDHTNYTPPKETKDMDEETLQLILRGCAPNVQNTTTTTTSNEVRRKSPVAVQETKIKEEKIKKEKKKSLKKEKSSKRRSYSDSRSRSRSR